VLLLPAPPCACAADAAAVAVVHDVVRGAGDPFNRRKHRARPLSRSGTRSRHRSAGNGSDNLAAVPSSYSMKLDTDEGGMVALDSARDADPASASLAATLNSAVNSALGSFEGRAVPTGSDTHRSGRSSRRGSRSSRTKYVRFGSVRWWHPPLCQCRPSSCLPGARVCAGCRLCVFNSWFGLRLGLRTGCGRVSWPCVVRLLTPGNAWQRLVYLFVCLCLLCVVTCLPQRTSQEA